MYYKHVSMYWNKSQNDNKYDQNDLVELVQSDYILNIGMIYMKI